MEAGGAYKAVVNSYWTIWLHSVLYAHPSYMQITHVCGGEGMNTPRIRGPATDMFIGNVTTGAP
jgi:hypothetical protein